jgi:hypothetical protein
MPTNTPVQGFRVPVSSDDPDVVDDMTQLALGIEKRVMGVYTDATARDAAVSGVVQEGMFAYLKSDNSTWYYDGAAWVSWPPRGQKIGSGSSVPTNSDPNYINGDVFFQV